MSGARLNIVAVVVYLAVMTAVIYGAANRNGSDVTEWIAFAGPLAASIALGVVVRRWWAFLLPLALVFIAIAAGYAPPAPPEEYANEEIIIPIWGWFIFYAPFFAILIGIGRLGRWAVDRFRVRPS